MIEEIEKILDLARSRDKANRDIAMELRKGIGNGYLNPQIKLAVAIADYLCDGQTDRLKIVTKLPSDRVIFELKYQMFGNRIGIDQYFHYRERWWGTRSIKGYNGSKDFTYAFRRIWEEINVKYIVWVERVIFELEAKEVGNYLNLNFKIKPIVGQGERIWVDSQVGLLRQTIKVPRYAPFKNEEILEEVRLALQKWANENTIWGRNFKGKKVLLFDTTRFKQVESIEP